MLADIKNENNYNEINENDNKYDNQIKKRRLNLKTQECNNVTSSLPTSSPPRSPNSVQSFNNIIIKTPNISRILSHLSIRTPKKKIMNNASSPLNLLNELHNTKVEQDPLLSSNVFIQTPQPSQPSSPSAASKKDQKKYQLSKELLQNKFGNFKQYKNASTPKSTRSINLNSTPTKSLKAMNLDVSLTPSKGSEFSFNNFPASPSSSFVITTPTKGKNKLQDNYKNNKEENHMVWFKSISNDLNKEDDNEEDIFKYKRMNIIPIINIKNNEFNYRDTDKDSLSSITDDTLSYTSLSTSSSSYNFFNHHFKHHNLKKDKKNMINPTRLNNTNKIEKFPLSPELSFLRSSSLYSSSLEKEEYNNKSQVQIKNDSLNSNFSSSNINILNNNPSLNKEIIISESLSSSTSSLLQKSFNNSSFLATVNNDIFNPKNNLNMDAVSEIGSNAETISISDISMFIDEDDNNDFIPLENQKNNNTINTPEIHSVTNKNNELNSTTENNNSSKSISKHQDTIISKKSNTIFNSALTHNKDNDSLKTTDSSALNSSNKTNLYNGFLNIDGIWEDPSLSQCEARNLKDSNLDSDRELDEEIENLSRSQSFPSTPKMRYNESTSSATSTPRNNKSSKKTLKKSNQPLLLNLDGTSSPVSLERLHSLPNLNSPLRKSFSKEKQFTAVNKLNLQKQPLKPYRRTNSLSSYCSSSSSSSVSNTTITINKDNKLISHEKIPSWSERKRKNLTRSNSVSDISESLSSERKRSFSSLIDEEENEYTSDASSIKRSPSSLRKLNARRKNKEKLNKTLHQKYDGIEEKKNNGLILAKSHLQEKRKNKIEKEKEISIKKEDEVMMNKESHSITNDQDFMSISTEIVEINHSESNKNKNIEIEEEEEKEKFNENRVSLLSDPSLTNLEYNEIQNKKKHENKENVHVLCNMTDGLDEKATLSETSSSPPPIVPREMIFVDEKGNVYNEQNYKFLSNYTKAIIAAELSKRYCRIPLTEILVSNMPEYRQYFDENGQLKPNNYIYVEEDSNDDDDDNNERKEENNSNTNNKLNIQSSNKNSINTHTKNDQPTSESHQNHYYSSNINLIKNDSNTTIQFRTEPINEEKEMIFESKMSPKGKQEWQDITETSLHSYDDDFDDAVVEWDTKDHFMENNKPVKNESKKDNKKSQKNERKSNNYNNDDKDGDDDDDEIDENDVDFVEKIDEKITIIYRTNESKYQLVIPIKLNIYNKKDTMII